MKLQERFKIGDPVYWHYSNNKHNPPGEGVIEEINSDGDYMSIHLPWIQNCHASISAKRVGNQWLVYRPYQDYLEPLYKSKVKE